MSARRLARRVHSAVHTLGVHHWKALCALLFSSPKLFLKEVIQRLLSRAQNDSVVWPFARAALYQDGLSRSSYHTVIVINYAPLIIFSEHDERLSLASTPGRHSTSSAGMNQERSKLGTAGLFARASCASGPGVKRPCQERPADCLSWAWSMWRTVVTTTANYHALETCTNFTILERKACIRCSIRAI